MTGLARLRSFHLTLFVACSFFVAQLATTQEATGQKANQSEARNLFEEAVRSAIVNAKAGERRSRSLLGIPAFRPIFGNSKTDDDYIEAFLAKTYHGIPSPLSYSNDLKNVDRVLEWEEIRERIQRAAELGFAPAQSTMTRVGAGKPTPEENFKAAFEWAEKAAAQGYAPALVYIAERYLWSENKPEDVVPFDLDKALQLIRSAAESDYAEAQGYLGNLHARSTLYRAIGTPIDRIEGFKWFEIATVNDLEHREDRDQVAFFMSSSEIAEGQKRASEWLKRKGKEQSSGLPILTRPIDAFQSVDDPAPVRQDEDCRWENTSSQEVARASTELKLNSEESLALWSWHDPGTSPGQQRPEFLLSNRYFMSNYHPDLKVPMWTQYRMPSATPYRLAQRVAFRADPRLETEQSGTCRDYSDPSFVAGLMAPPSHTARTVAGEINNYLLSNTAPRACTLDRGAWRGLLEAVKHWGQTREPFYVNLGLIFDHDNDGQRDQNEIIPRLKSRTSETDGIAIPSHFYVIASNHHFSELVALVIPNEPVQLKNEKFPEWLDSKRVSLEWIEARTGLEYFTSKQSRYSLRNQPGFLERWTDVYPLMPLPESVDIESGLVDCPAN